eukprot:335674-Prorocentrum_minimum.AAC.2
MYAGLLSACPCRHRPLCNTLRCCDPGGVMLEARPPVTRRRTQTQNRRNGRLRGGFAHFAGELDELGGARQAEPDPLAPVPSALASAPDALASAPNPLVASAPKPSASTPDPLASTPDPLASTPDPLASTPDPL